ncbi:putative disease resistance RPP13-like protein 1 [Tripterygium wilfordii]|uniref:putative disease resistance RPP13-like protein 1 n=1 Tax=Tripterygium wilfordii TaxID=458696 RepID=UPI0018F850E1|nr:putative disease resistance RPP13-like protein 1 [Tripterygium wilfordii]
MTGFKKEYLQVFGLMMPLEELLITNYSGIMFPDWLGHPSFSKLVILTLRSSRWRKVLPSLGRLPVLEELCIDDMHELKIINHDFCGSAPSGAIQGFPSLTKLRFHDMLEWVTWEGLNAMDMPRLQHLMIEECRQLKTIPSLQYLTSLENLEFSQCPAPLPMQLLLDSLGSLIINE